MITETGTGGVIDFDAADRECAETLAAQHFGGNYVPTHIEAGIHLAAANYVGRRITLAFRCVDAPDAGW